MGKKWKTTDFLKKGSRTYCSEGRASNYFLTIAFNRRFWDNYDKHIYRVYYDAKNVRSLTDYLHTLSPYISLESGR